VLEKVEKTPTPMNQHQRGSRLDMAQTNLGWGQRGASKTLKSPPKNGKDFRALNKSGENRKKEYRGPLKSLII